MKSGNIPAPTPQRIFYSYAFKDESYREMLEIHLSLLRRQGLVEGWHARNISAGEEWAEEIDAQLDVADIVLLLISSNFLASDYCYDKEMARALERHEAGEVRVIPILIKPCDWQAAPFAKLQGLPRNATPVSKWEDEDEAWLDVAQGIRAVIDMR